MRNVLVAGLLAAGCASSPLELRPWPQTPPQGAPSAVLLKLSADLDMSGYYVTLLRIGFQRPQEMKAKTWEEFQHIDISGDDINKFPRDVILVPMQPGAYRAVVVKVLFSRNETHSLDQTALQAGEKTGPNEYKLRDFVVEPGKITVIGTVDVSATIKVTNANGDGSQNFDGHVNVNWTDDDSAKLDVLEMALMRPEPQQFGWREAIEAAREQVYARVHAAAVAKRQAERAARAQAKAEAEARARAEAEAQAKANAETPAAEPAAAVATATAAPPPAPETPAAPPAAELPPAKAPPPPVLVASAAPMPAARPPLDPDAPLPGEPVAVVKKSSERLGFTLEVGMGAGMAEIHSDQARSSGPGLPSVSMSSSLSGPGPAVNILLGAHVTRASSLGVRFDSVGAFNDQGTGAFMIVGGDFAHWLGERALIDFSAGLGVKTFTFKDSTPDIRGTGFGLHAGFAYDLVHGQHNGLQLNLALGWGIAQGSMEHFAAGLAYHLY